MKLRSVQILNFGRSHKYKYYIWNVHLFVQTTRERQSEYNPSAHGEFVVNTSLVEEDSPEITDLSGNDIVLDKKRNHSEKNTYIPNFNNCGN